MKNENKRKEKNQVRTCAVVVQRVEVLGSIPEQRKQIAGGG